MLLSKPPVFNLRGRKPEYTIELDGYVGEIFRGKHISADLQSLILIMWTHPDGSHACVGVQSLKTGSYNKFVKHSFDLVKPLLDNYSSLKNIKEDYLLFDLLTLKNLRFVLDEVKRLRLSPSNRHLTLEVLTVWENLSPEIASYVTKNLWFDSRKYYIDFYIDDTSLVFIATAGYALTYVGRLNEPLKNLTKNISKKRILKNGLTQKSLELFFDQGNRKTLTGRFFLENANNSDLRWWLKKFSPRHLKTMSFWSVYSRNISLGDDLVKQLIDAYTPYKKMFNTHGSSRYVKRMWKEGTPAAPHVGLDAFVYGNLYSQRIFLNGVFCYSQFDKTDKYIFNNSWTKSFEDAGLIKNRLDDTEEYSPGGHNNDRQELETIAVRLLFIKTNIEKTLNIYTDFLTHEGSFSDFIKYVLSYEKYKNSPVSWLLTLGLDD